jgi:hypothetical protein
LSYYVFKGPVDTLTGDKPEQLYWSSADGWGGRETATVFCNHKDIVDFPAFATGVEFL